MEEVKKVFTTNKHGLKIVKCCASCEHCGRDETKERARLCMIGKGVHSNDYLCEDWKIEKTPRDKQHKAARSLNDVMLEPTGGVKKPDYIRFVQVKLDELEQHLCNKKPEYTKLVEKSLKARGEAVNKKVVIPKVNRMLKEYHERYIAALPSEYESKHGSRYLVMAQTR